MQSHICEQREEVAYTLQLFPDHDNSASIFEKSGLLTNKVRGQEAVDMQNQWVLLCMGGTMSARGQTQLWWSIGRAFGCMFVGMQGLYEMGGSVYIYMKEVYCIHGPSQVVMTYVVRPYT